ncbi:MAG: ATP-binding protein, partial [Thermodesulfobacteriota bacterium]
RSEPRVEISTRCVSPREIVLVVEDNGVGIRNEDQPRVFTPFFTSEPMIGRPGLGLSKVFALVSGFGGEASFTSQEGRGARFNIKLPVFTPGNRS